MAKSQQTTVYSVLLSGFYLTLATLSGQRDIVIGTPSDNRHHAQTQSLIGFFVNSLALRIEINPDATVQALIAQVHELVTQAKIHQELPFEKLVDALGVERDPSRHPLFQVMFSVQGVGNNVTPSSLPFDACGVDDFNPENGDSAYSPAKFDLSVFLTDAEAEIQGTFNYALSLFEAPTIARMAAMYQRVIRALVQVNALAEIDYLGEQERHTLLHHWNDTDAPYPQEATLHQQFELQVALTPNNIALCFEDQTLTYQALNEQANRLAYIIREHYLFIETREPKSKELNSKGITGVDADTLIALYLDRSPQMVISILAVLKAGAAYVPIATDYPKERTQFILNDTQSALVLTQQQHITTLDAWLNESAQVPILIAVDTLELSKNTSHSSTNLSPFSKARDLAYVIYTSGTTGRPKGVMVSHGSVVNRINWMQSQYPLDSSDRVLQKTPYSFDVSVWELLWANWVGASIVIAAPELHKDPEAINQLILSSGVTCIHFVPSMLDAYHHNLKHLNRRLPQTLKWVFCSGEALSCVHVQAHQSIAHDNSRFINLYGPTEAAIDVTYFDCTHHQSNVIPIGAAIDNTRLYILNNAQKLVPMGGTGELYLGGAGLARGYLNRPELTQERFIENPFATEEDKAKGYTRLYKTGDLVRWLPGSDGQLEYLGRNDSQVKIRGYRIELGEIESALLENSALKQVVVIDHIHKDGAQQGNRSLAAYIVGKNAVGKSVVGKNTSELDINAIRQYLSARLPDYMVPSSFTEIEVIPLTINGKLDRKSLPEPIFSHSPGKQYSAARTPVEQALARIWSEVLSIEKVGVFDNFFDLGGHSLLAVQLIAEINSHFSEANLPPVLRMRDLFDTPTVSELALKIEDMGQPSSAESSVNKVEENKPTFDINSEVQLISAVENHALPPYSGDLSKANNILLTGASGFLGAFLLHELLEQSTANIYCLVRASSNEAAQHRLVDQLKCYHSWDDATASRIITLCGDLSQPLLGLAQEAFEHLGRKIDIIYHNGALVNHFYPYSILKAPNVSGTQEVLRLATTSKLKPVHYVSTIGVLSVPSEQGGGVKESVLSENGLPTDGNVLAGGYNQSKWVTEKILQKAQDCGVPVTVYRPAIVGGHSQSGVWNVKDFRSLMIYASLNLGYWPDMDMHWNIAPVEYVSKSIVYLSSRRDSQGETFHPVNSQDINSRQVFELLEKMGYQITPCSPEEWASRLRDTAKASQDDNLLGLSALFDRPTIEGKRGDDKKDVLMSTIDSRYSSGRISEGDIKCPVLDERILKNYLSFFEACGFIPNQADINRRIINNAASKQDTVRPESEMLTTEENF
ncbi:MAG: hypothetical protein COA42_15310 [Alteromonadaceae bacterium]|nr:MAG: hypothetical protein COA42_15310 [Alteromonadaceae bacterium]